LNAFATTTGGRSPSGALWSTMHRAIFGEAGSATSALPAVDVAELLRRADAYEATQPGYAADLRAAAMRVSAAT